MATVEWRLWHTPLPLFSLLFLLVGLVGCVSTLQSDRGLLPPVFEAAVDAATGEPIVVSSEQFVTAVVQHTWIVPLMDDGAYLLPSHQWVQQFNRYIAVRRRNLEFKGALGYRPEWPDCDDYSKLYLAAVLLSNSGKHPFPPLVGSVNLRHAPGGVEGAHQMVFYVTDRGLFFFEPQNGTETRIASLDQLLDPTQATALRAKLQSFGVYGVRVELREALPFFCYHCRSIGVISNSEAGPSGPADCCSTQEVAV